MSAATGFESCTDTDVVPGQRSVGVKTEVLNMLCVSRLQSLLVCSQDFRV